MTKKKKSESVADVISELLELAEKVRLPDGYFDGDVQDESQDEAKKVASDINEGTLMGQLEYLYMRGYSKERLAELIREHQEKS